MSAARGRWRRSRLALASIGLAVALLASLAALGARAAAAGATSLTPGDVVVYRVGNGGSLSGSATPVFLDEYNASGTLVESVALPTSTEGSNKPLLASGTASSEGELSLSTDGKYVVLTGYDTTVGHAEVAETSSSSVPRTVGRVSASGEVNTTTALTNFSTENNARSVASTNGSEFWVGGAGGGALYATLGASTGTPLSSSVTNVRVVSIFDGQLYTSADPTKKTSGNVKIATIGSGLPTTGGQSFTNLSFSPTAPAEAYAYAFVTLGSGPGPDTLYVAEFEHNAMVKYGLASGKWVEEGSVSVPDVTGLIANDSKGTVTLFATDSGANGNEGALYKITDTSGLGGTLSGTPDKIAVAASGEAFRGVAYAPGTTFGEGGNEGGEEESEPEPEPEGPTVAPSGQYLAGAIDDPTNPVASIEVGDTEYASSELTVTASSSDTTVAPEAGISVSGSGATRTVSVTPAAVGYSTITLTIEAPNKTKTTATITYAASAYQGDPSDRYYEGAGNGSTAIDVGQGYMILGDDESNVLRLYKERQSGLSVKTFDFTNVLPFGTEELDIEASARAGDMLYWMGSQSNSKKGKLDPERDVVFAARITGEGANTELTYVGANTNLRKDLIRWDEANGNPLGFKASTAEGIASNQDNGFNVEGLEFAPSSTSDAYVAFRAPLESPTERNKALLVPVTNFSSLVTSPVEEATFGAPVEWNTGGLGLREIRKNANNQYLAITGTPDDSNSTFGLYSWDGNPADQPVLTRTHLASVEEGAWESIVSVPTPLQDGAEVELLEDNGEADWYGDGHTSKDGLPEDLQKDLGRMFTIELAEQQITWESTPPATPTYGEAYELQASASSGLPVTYSIDPASTGGACTLEGGTVTFTGLGECVIDAEQAGDESYAPASTVKQSLTVTDSRSSEENVGGEVPSTLALSVGSGSSSLGQFVPGASRAYTTTLAAKVTSSAGNATLSAYDPSSTDTGHLVNGSYELGKPLEIRAADPADKSGVFAPIGSTGSPLTLLSYAGPVSNDPVTIGFKQAIEANEALRTGSYGKTIVLTLSTTNP
ncbi:MAG TPA: hypothetical protein VGF95_00360 [Solirubrobacteraceae bacterium]